MKVLFDTCLYIDWFRAGKRSEIFNQEGYLRFLSPVVAMELVAGAVKDDRHVELLISAYLKARRIVNLTSTHYIRAGECLSRLASSGLGMGKGFSNDVLIAFSARSIGATLFTANRKDFEWINRHVKADIEYV